MTGDSTRELAHADDDEPAVSLRVQLLQAEGKDAVGFVVPPDAVATLGHGARDRLCVFGSAPSSSATRSA